MKLAEYEHCVLIEDFFSPGIIAGFTKPNLKGVLPEDILRAFSSLNLSPAVADMFQLHSSLVYFTNSPGTYNADGLFTQENNQAVLVKSADCLPIYFSSSSSETIGIVHMGWLGAKQGILDNLNHKLKSFKVAFGVGLRRCCYRVGNEFLSYPRLSKYVEKYQSGLRFNTVKFAREELSRLGVRADNFWDLDICSFCSQDKFFSFRRTKAEQRTLSFILKH